MRSKILKSSLGLLLGCSIVGSIATVNSPVTASNSQLTKSSPNHLSVIIAATPVKQLDIGTYKDMTKGAVVGDNLTPDHIPSFAAIKFYRKATEAQAEPLRQGTCTIVYSGTIHKDSSRTHGGRNSEALIKSDGASEASLKKAFDLDKAAIEAALVKSEVAAGSTKPKARPPGKSPAYCLNFST